MCRSKFCEYWKQDWHSVKPCWNDGFILDVIKVVLWVIRKFSIINCVVFHIKKHHPDKFVYRAVDSYVLFWFLLSIGFLVWLSNTTPNCIFSIVFVVFASYRLLDIFQTWVGNFLLKDPDLRNSYRTLILTFVGYGEVVFWYSILAFIFKNNFIDIGDWQQSLYYAMGTVTIGTDIKSNTPFGFVMFSTQLMFTILFLSVVVNKIISLTK